MPRRMTKVFGENYPLIDSRLENVRLPHFAYCAPDPKSKAEWNKRAQWVRQRILLSAGLRPMPKRAPLKARVYDRAELDGYSVEKVRFESRPGFLVTGNLYRPASARGRRPAILSPHGHWPDGRMAHDELGSVRNRCAMLARLGFVVFTYDMVGYCDSCQMTHRWTGNVARHASLYGIGMFSLQLWNSIRAADFLCDLPDVNPNRLGCTGASGGATQTYYLAAVDDRIRVVVPVCMASAHYQGGCACEEPPLVHLRDMTTLDVVGSLAPRPVFLPSVTQDWTNQNPSYDVPALKRVYALYDAADRVGNAHFDAPHNYNKDSREHMVAWFVKWLGDNPTVGRRIREPKLAIPSTVQARLFPSGKPPASYRRGKRLLQKFFVEEARPFAKPPATRSALTELRSEWLPVYADLLDCAEPDEPVSIGPHRPLGPGDGFAIRGRILARRGRGEQIPAAWIVPDTATARSPAMLAVCENGKRDLLWRGRLSPVLSAFVARGVRVLAIDMLGTGETAPLLKREPVSRLNPVFHAFNRSLTAHRVQDILLALAVLRQHDGVRRPVLAGFGMGGVMALLARPLAGPLASTMVDVSACATGADAFWCKTAYHPLIRKLGDARGAVALGPNSPLMLATRDAGLARWARAVYGLQNKSSSLRVASRPVSPASAAAWVCRTHGRG